MKSKLSIAIKIFIFLIIALLIGVGVLVYQVKKELPSSEVIENYQPISPSVIYDINGNQLDVITLENREPVHINEVPLHVQNAFLAIEDRKFRTHHGFDFMRLGRAVLSNITGSAKEGGSSITQQLAKNAFLSPERSFDRKLKEAVLAIEIERKYTKDEILENYLNTIYFGNGSYGIKNAARKYFDKDTKDLTIAEAAILASIPKSPTKYSPVKNYDNAIERQKIVLSQMYKYKFITEAQYEEAQNQKIVLSKNSGITDDVNEDERISISNNAPEFTSIAISEAKRILKIDDSDQKALFDGYKIYTTVDLDMQRAAYKAFHNNYNLKRRESLNGALISMDPNTGFVKAMVGGKNYKKGDFNRALVSTRQPGSSFKPFIYLAAIQKGIPMNTVIEDSPFTTPGWSPNNFDRKFRGSMSLLKAVEISNNVVPVKLLQLIGIDSVEKIWRDVGVEGGDFPKDLTLALGSITTNPISMAKGYAAIANGGYRVKPLFIYKIENKYGEVVYDAKKEQEKVKVFQPEDVALLTYMLESAVKFGTGQSAKVFKNGQLIPEAGKTGTTSDYGSAWFTGYTPTLVTIVYVGNDNNKSMGGGMTGGAAAAPIWKNYMQSVVNLEGFEVGNFAFIDDYLKSKDLSIKDIDLKTGLLDTDNVDKRSALFKIGTEPIESQNKYKTGLEGFI
ncbi:MAG: PBP1A family penicillin-binding protein [Sebaldella sp.]|nr:PBP1A family penicillin-binding protein [Sebaldella sp.]